MGKGPIGTWTILALLIGIILGIIVMVVVNYFRGKSGESKATKLIERRILSFETRN